VSWRPALGWLLFVVLALAAVAALAHYLPTV
jgi:hypothetical protein